ncbi:MAG TPA: FtsQ-type POTRA domain-containing protein [Acidimicrobiia bacterium]|nr:FtsQ-type POTRA domain-containing protein [Acidimicrobiia bacterium]
MTIDPRLAERRKHVAEDKAKQNMGRLLKFLTVVLVVGSLVWLALSPWLSISQVDSTGISVSTGHAVLVERGVIAGTPMIQVSESGTESALMSDPWIESADVDKHWPDRVTVTVVERVPVAWTNTESGWTRRAVDGVALPSGPEPDEEMAWVDMPHLAAAAAETAPEMLGALQFIEALPADLQRGAVVTSNEGELWAFVAGYQVRLGRGVEMREKALSLDALLDRDIPEGSLLNVIAPTHPSYLAPGAASGDDDAPPQASADSDDGEATDENDENG